MTGIDPDSARVQLDIGGLGSAPSKARLSLDVTRKPLINLVWYGLYVVLAGGLLATFARFRQARILDRIDAARADDAGDDDDVGDGVGDAAADGPKPEVPSGG